MGKNIWRRTLSGLSIVSLLINSLLPFSLAGSVYAQESTASATLESPSPSPSVSPDPTAIPSATPSPSISPSPTATPSASPEASASAIPSPSSEVDATPEPSTDSASVSQEKIPLREEGTFLKEAKDKQDKDYVEGEVIVKFKKEKIDVKRTFGRAKAYVFEKKFALDKKDEIKELNIRVFKSKKSTEEMVRELNSDSKVEYAEPNYLRFPTTIITNDTHKDLLWGLDNTGQTVNETVGTNDADIDAPEAWEISEGSGDVIVAVIDSGVAYNHPDLAGNMWDGSSCKDETGTPLEGCNHGYDFENNDNTPLPDGSSHGTHVAGIIAAAKNNAKGVIGVAPNTKIMALKFSWDIVNEIKSIDFAIQNGAKIINASFGGEDFSQTEYDAINRFESAGGIFITVAGNESSNNESVHNYPSDYDLDNIISVTATDQNDGLASFSNYGATSVDVGAPGINIYSTVLGETAVLFETFESVTPPNIPNGWTKAGINNNWGTYPIGGSWGNVLYGDLYYPYTDSVDTTITSSTYNLALSSVSINFWAACDTEYKTDGWYDYMQLEYSSDGVSFSPAIDPFTGEEFRWDEPTFDILNGDPLDDSGTSVFHYENILIPSQYLTSSFNFRFRWVSNSSDNDYGGCLIDDVELIKYSDGSDEQYGYMDGTSMAAPYVAGLASLIWSYRPGLTYNQVKNTILSTGDSIPDLHPTTGIHPINSGKRINANEALLSLESPTIIGLSDDLTPIQSKTWNWDSNDATDQFRHLIDQTEESVPSGAYSGAKTATQSAGDGIYYLHVQAKSAAGVESAVTTVSVVLDNTASVINVTSPLSSVVVSGSSIVELTNTEEVNPECSINNSDWVSCTSGVTILNDITGFGSLAEGAFSLYVRDIDVAGNVGSDTEVGIIKDSTEPTGLITSPADGSTSASVPVFTASANDDNGVASVKFQYKASGAGSFIDMNTDTSAPFEADWSGVSLVSNTTYDLKIIVEDTVGNSANFSGVSFTYDITAPDQPIITNPASSLTVNSNDYSIEGAAEAGSLVKAYSGSSVVGSQQLAGGETNFSIVVPLTQDATNSFEISSTDGVGNESGKTAVSAITEDSTDPGIDSYSLDNPVISPQVSAGIKDTASIDLWFTEEVDYLISIKDGGVVVRSWSGSATNPWAKIWDGKDTGGSYVADGTYTIEIIITDDADNSITDTSKTIIVDNDPLTLDPIGDKSINENEALTFTASASNDEGDPVGFSLTGAPVGAAIDPVTGGFSWTPTEAQGPGSYALNVNTVSGDLSKSEEIIITVNEVNQAPVALDDSVTTNEDTPVTIILSATDADLPAQILTYSIVDGTTNGVLGLVNVDQVTYTPNGDYNGEDSFTFKANDGIDDSNTATISITVDAINDAPVAVADVASVDEDAVLTVAKATLISNDQDIDGDSLTLSSVFNPVNGTVEIVVDDVVFIPTANYFGLASFDYTVFDGSLTDTTTVAVTVDPVNDAPVADDGVASTVEEAPVTIDLVANDIDDDPLTYLIVDGPANGSLGAVSGNQVTYTPNSNYTGPDSFTFKVNDGTDDSNTATVSITVSEVNDPPVLDPIGDKSVDELTTLTFTATATDPDSSLTYSLISAPAGASIDPDTGVFSFTPTEAQGPGGYTLTVNVTDGFSIDFEEITITVNEVNQAPVALDDSVTTNEDTPVTIILSATDADLPAQILTYSIVDGTTNGVLGLVNVDQVTYTPNGDYNGEDSFTFKANDGIDDSNTATISITVDAINDAPVAVADVASVDEDAVLTVAKATLISNDQDIDGDSLTLSSVFNPVNGTVEIVVDDVVFIPTANYFGLASFDYTVFDGSLTDTTTVAVTVDPVNDAPVADDGVASTVEEAPVTIDLVANDIDDDPLTYLIVDGPANGSLGAVSGNQVTYTPNSNYTGPDSFTFKVNDGTDDSNTATVSITVNLLVISSESTNTPSETSVTITWTSNHLSSSRVIYDTVSHGVLGAAPNYGYANSTAETNISPKVISHSVIINGLTAETTYYYRVVSHGSPEVVGDEKSLRTADKSSDDDGGDDDGGGDTSTSSSDDSSTDSSFNPYAQLMAGTTGGFASEVLGERATDDIDQDLGDIKETDQESKEEVLGVKKSTNTLKYLLALGLLVGIVGLVLKKKQRVI